MWADGREDARKGKNSRVFAKHRLKYEECGKVLSPAPTYLTTSDLRLTPDPTSPEAELAQHLFPQLVTTLTDGQLTGRGRAGLMGRSAEGTWRILSPTAATTVLGPEWVE